MNRTKLFSRTVFLFLFCCALLLGCAKGGQEVETGTAYTIFYLNAAGNQLSGTEYRTETAGQDELIQELLGCMTQVPPDLDCLSAIPERIEKITYRVEENVLYLYADANYALMGAVEEILCRAALVKTLTQFMEFFGAERLVAVSREISKLHETTHRGTLAELADYFSENAPRGEIVIVVEGKKPEKNGLKKDKYAQFKTDKHPML